MNIDRSQIKTFNRRTEKEITPMTINFFKGRGKIAFSISLQEATNMRVSDRISFLSFGKDWYMVISNNPDDYHVTKQMEKKGLSYLCINSAYFHRHFLSQIGGQPGDIYYVQATDKELDGLPLFQILTDKAVNKVGINHS